MKKKFKRIPALRFSEFDREWVKTFLNQCCKFSKGKGISKADITQDGKRKCVRYGELYTTYGEVINEVLSKTNIDDSELILSQKNDVVIPSSGETREDIATASCIIENEIALGGDLNIIKTSHDGIFLSYNLNGNSKRKIARLAQGASVIHLYPAHLKSLKLSFPTLPEQKKIASFLNTIDKKIELLTRKNELLKQYKKGVMQKIFSQKIRFQGKNKGLDFPDWEEKRFGEMFVRVTEKNKENNQNVLTPSAQHGIINQQEFFNKRIASADVTGYYLIKNGDFVYNKSYCNGYPMGAIKRLNRYAKGVVSTLYICFRIKGEGHPEYFEEFLDAGGINQELHKIAQEGARNHGLLNVSVVEFFKEIKFIVPSALEQKRIAGFLCSLSLRIEAVSKRLEETKNFKKGLLQKMFV